MDAAGSADGGGLLAAVLAADAAACVRVWAVRLHSLIEGSAASPYQLPLEHLYTIELSSGRQPCSLALMAPMSGGRTSPLLVCGCADGAVEAIELADGTCALPHAHVEATELAASSRVATDAAAAAADATGAEAAAEGGARRQAKYAWMFDSGAGPQARGLLREKRRFFDGWARTANYELGLQQVRRWGGGGG